MKIYRVVDNGSPTKFTADLVEIARQFIELSKKYPQNTWYWVEEDDL